MGLRTTTKTSTHGGGSTFYEDFTTYNETDGPTKVTVTANTITLTNGDRDEDYYVTKDFGANYFGDFTHWVDVNVTSITDDSTSGFRFWTLSDADDDLKDIDDANGDFVSLWVGRESATTYEIILQFCDSGTLESPVDTSSAINVNTSIYISVTRSGTTLTSEIYSTAALRLAGGSGDVDTVTGTVVNTAFRYIYGLASYNTENTAKDVSGTVSNLLLVN